MQEGLFVNPERARQLIDFQGLEWGYNNRPTDVDALFEYKDRLYIIVELKFRGNQMPFGQKLALERLCDDLSARKPALLIVATHTTPVGELVDLASATVDEFRVKGEWRFPLKPWTVRVLMDKFINAVMRKI